MEKRRKNPLTRPPLFHKNRSRTMIFFFFFGGGGAYPEYLSLGKIFREGISIHSNSLVLYSLLGSLISILMMTHYP